MKIDFQIFLDAIGFVQGVVFGGVFIVLNKRKDKSTFFLGLFLLLFSLKLGHFISRNLNLIDDYPRLLLLPFNFSWLLLPLFFIYTQQVSIFSNRKSPYWVLIPGFIAFLLQLIIFFLPYQTKLELSQNPWHDFFFTFIGIFYSLAIALWNLKVLNKHQIEVRNSFSHIESKELQWARFFLIYSILVTILIHVMYYISPQKFYFKILFSIFDLIAIYWISYYGILQRNIMSILNKEESGTSFVRKTTNKVSKQLLSDKDLQEISKQIDNYMNTSEAFTNSNFTIVDLAENLKIHPKRISIVINKIQHQNFNSYVNQFRIEKVAKILENNTLENFSIEGIGHEVGFHSKSAFYCAFKKVTGTTPIRYKKRKIV